MIEFARGQIQQAPWVRISNDALDETLMILSSSVPLGTDMDIIHVKHMHDLNDPVL